METLDCDILVAGAGIGGISAALAAARLGARTLLVEARDEIGGTGVHSPVALICTYRDRTQRPINLGLHREFFPHLYDTDGREIQVYDEAELLQRYRCLCAAEPLLAVRCRTPVTGVERDGAQLVAVLLGGDKPLRVRAAQMVDGTANGDLSALAGATCMLGRDGDGALQPATLTFSVDSLAWERFDPPLAGIATWKDYEAVRRQLDVVYQQGRADGRISSPRHNVLCFPYPDRTTLLFNQTRILGVDPTVPGAVEAAYREGERQVHAFLAVMRSHPAMAGARLRRISPMLGLREGRRILGGYLLRETDCLGEARFDDMVAACAYALDIHNPVGGGSRLQAIPGSGYYHIPWRCLVAEGIGNLLLGSRCISGTHEAHSSYRVMAPVSAIGQAAGTGAALAVRLGLPAAAVDASWIRHELAKAGQFVEGVCRPPPA